MAFNSKKSSHQERLNNRHLLILNKGGGVTHPIYVIPLRPGATLSHGLGRGRREKV
jgi:hypothetical protein